MSLESKWSEDPSESKWREERVKERYLTSRKALDDQNAETAESITKLNDLKSKLAEYESQCLEHTTAIASAKGRCDEFTRGDVGRLQRMSLVFFLFFFPSSSSSWCAFHMPICLSHGMRGEDLDEDLKINRSRRSRRLTNRRIWNPPRSTSMENQPPKGGSTPINILVRIGIEVQLSGFRSWFRICFDLFTFHWKRTHEGVVWVGSI